MGFGSKSRKQAKKDQEAAMAAQRAQQQAFQAQVDKYQASNEKRNAGLIAMRDGGINWLERFGKGEDVAKLNPAFAKNNLAAAEATKKTMNFASKLGDTSTHGGGDADYQAKMRSQNEREIGKGLAFANMQGLQDELGNQRGIVMDATNMLNADARAGIGMQGDSFNMTSTIFSSATQKRQMEIQRSQYMMNMFAQTIAGGISGVMGAFGAGGMFGAGGAFGGPPTAG